MSRPQELDTIYQDAFELAKKIQGSSLGTQTGTLYEALLKAREQGQRFQASKIIEALQSKQSSMSLDFKKVFQENLKDLLA